MTRFYIFPLGLATLAALGLTALPQAARAQTTVNGTYVTTDVTANALGLTSTGNQSAGPSPTPAQDPNNAYVLSGGTYSATGDGGTALATEFVTANINGGAFTGNDDTLYLYGSTVTVTGGTFAETESANPNVQNYGSTLSVYGGTFTQPQGGEGFFIDGDTTFYGNFTPKTITDTGSSDLTGSFTGTLVDDATPQTFTYDIAPGSTLRLVNPNVSPTPEPSAFVGLGIGLLGLGALAVKARRRNAA